MQGRYRGSPHTGMPTICTQDQKKEIKKKEQQPALKEA
jgi:hypothetical protein